MATRAFFLSTAVAELRAFMKCFGASQMRRGLWAGISGAQVLIHIRADSSKLVITSAGTHLPDQQDTMHMVQMLRKETLSGAIEDLAHVRTHVWVGAALAKASAKPDAFKEAVATGSLVGAGRHPSVRPWYDTVHSY